jgi:hypothetical protein
MPASLARAAANEAQVPGRRVILAIVDNYVTHKQPKLRDRLSAPPLDLTLHPNFGLLAHRRRRLLRQLTMRRLKRGIFGRRIADCHHFLPSNTMSELELRSRSWPPVFNRNMNLSRVSNERPPGSELIGQN